MSHIDPHRPIRVLHLGSPTGLYGAERWILTLAKHLPLGHVESWVAVIRDAVELEAPLCEHAAQLRLKVHIFESPGKLSLSAIGQLRRFVRERDIDVLHTHGYKTDVIGRLATMGLRCKTVATPHGWSRNAGIKLQAYEVFDRFMFLFIDAVAPLSPGLYEQLVRIPGLRGRLHLIPNGVDLSDQHSTCEPPEQLRAMRSAGTFIVGYIGQLITRKRVDTLIRAFHRLDVPRKHLCLVGEGAQRSELERLVAELEESERVTFFGFREDRLALLRGFDVFVLPSELEGIPRCLMEAMGAGVPVVASDIAGCRELVEAGTSGQLFTAGNDAELAHQIRVLIDNPSLCVELAKAGRQRVHSSYSAEAMARSYLALYERLVERHVAIEPPKERA